MQPVVQVAVKKLDSWRIKPKIITTGKTGYNILLDNQPKPRKMRTSNYVTLHRESSWSRTIVRMGMSLVDTWRGSICIYIYSTVGKTP